MRFRTANLNGLPEFESYMDAIAQMFCPFIEPSQKRNVLFFSEYDLRSLLPEKIKAGIFYTSLIHTELLRRERRKQTTRIAHDMLSENCIFYFSANMDEKGEELFSWPHWMLKCLYTKTSIMFGKFWKGEQINSRDGRPIPPPPLHFLSIRSAIKPTDINFFKKAPKLTPEYLSSCDNGASVFEGVPFEVPSCVVEIENLSDHIFQAQFLLLLNKLFFTSFYEDVKEWSKKQCK